MAIDPGHANLPPYRLPAAGPTQTDLDERSRWQALSEQSLKSTQDAADKWRTGLAAFVTLVTGGLFIKGPSAASDMTTQWRVALTVLAAGGLLAAIVGLWLALRAAAGTPANLDYNDVVHKYGGIRQFEVACASSASRALRNARIFVGASLLLLGSAVITWWWAPSVPPPTKYLAVSTPAGPVCGTLVDSNVRVLRIQDPSTKSVTDVPLRSITHEQLVSAC